MGRGKASSVIAKAKALFVRWLHSLWWTMPWKLSHPDWGKGGKGHQSVDYFEDRDLILARCSCGRTFWRKWKGLQIREIPRGD